MFAKETYVQRRAQLKKTVGSGVLLFLGNDEQGLNYEDNTFRYRQDSTFLYYFGLSFAGLNAVIDIDEDREIIFGDELTIDYIARHHYPLVFVTSGRLGSINHLLLSLEAADRRGIRLHTLVYNLFPEEDDALIRQDTEEYIRHLLRKEYPDTRLEVVPCLTD